MTTDRAYSKRPDGLGGLLGQKSAAASSRHELAVYRLAAAAARIRLLSGYGRWSEQWIARIEPASVRVPADSA